MRYLIYAGVAGLVVWSAICLWRNVRRQLKGECDGCCGKCSQECSSRSDSSTCKNSGAQNGEKTNRGGENNENALSED